MKNFRSDTICNITHEPQELQGLHFACGGGYCFIGKCCVKIIINCYQNEYNVLTGKSPFDLLATASPSIHKFWNSGPLDLISLLFCFMRVCLSAKKELPTS